MGRLSAPEMSMREKVLLINPNFKYFPGWIENIANYKQLPLGLGYIASYLRKSSDVEISICDASGLNLNEIDVLRHVINFKPDLVGVSVHTTTVEFARRVSFRIKHIFPEVFIVFGGPHISAVPFENLDIADVCVIGEGEKTFAEIIGSVWAEKSLNSVEGIAFKENGSCRQTTERPFIEDLDSLPFPARDLFPIHRYRHNYPYRLMNPYYAAVLTARGCSFSCNFCLNDLLWKRKVRNRSLDNVFSEIEELVKYYNISLLRIGDDNFTEDANRVVDFCHRKMKYFPGLQWFCHSRADLLTRDLAKAMKSARCVEVQVGIESGDDAILERCNKKENTLAILNALKILKKEKINQWATFIIGNEGDTYETVQKTIDFAKFADPTYSSFLFLSPLPGTKSHDNLSKKGYIKSFNWGEYNFHSEPVFETEFLSKKTLLELRIRAYREFYIRPHIMFRYFYAAVISCQWPNLFLNALLLFKFIFGLIQSEDKNS